MSYADTICPDADPHGHGERQDRIEREVEKALRVYKADPSLIADFIGESDVFAALLDYFRATHSNNAASAAVWDAVGMAIQTKWEAT